MRGYPVSISVIYLYNFPFCDLQIYRLFSFSYQRFSYMCLYLCRNLFHFICCSITHKTESIDSHTNQPIEFVSMKWRLSESASKATKLSDRALFILLFLDANGSFPFLFWVSQNCRWIGCLGLVGSGHYYVYYDYSSYILIIYLVIIGLLTHNVWI